MREKNILLQKLTDSLSKYPSKFEAHPDHILVGFDFWNVCKTHFRLIFRLIDYKY